MKYTAATIGALAGTGLLSSTALAADLYAPPPVYEPVAEAAPAPVYFHGPYIGLHGGWGWSDVDSEYNDDDFNPGGIPGCGVNAGFGCAVDVDPDGAFVGGQIGWNWVFGSGLMLGLEGDYSFASLHDDDVGVFGGGAFATEVDLEVDQMATAVGRVGWVMGRWMPFLAGGWGWAHVERSAFNPVFLGPSPVEEDQWHDGWVAGGGVEFAINERWSVKGEYRYFDGGSEDYALGFADGTNVDLNIHTVRFGVNFGF